MLQIFLVVSSFAAGSVLRWACLGHVTEDTPKFLLPWYEYSLQHGWGALASAYTNYTPFYSYLLIAATHLDGVFAPLTLIKGISFVFELAMASLAYVMVRRLGGASQGLRPAAAFAGVWLAPTVVANGALWGQADSIWSFFLMLAVAAYCSGRNGIVGFAVALAIKAQAVFIGPFVLGLTLRRRTSWLWFAAIPAVYVVLALPVLVAGRSLGDVASIYLGQAHTSHRLSMDAANPWLFVPEKAYAIGTLCGMLIGALAGCVFAAAVARSKRSDPRWLLLLACATLFMMPYLLPKMHDRYFYAFEIGAIVLACIDPRFTAMAIIAQVDGIFAYTAFEGQAFGLPIAVFSNTILLVWLIRVIRAGGQVGPVSRTSITLYLALVAVIAVVMPVMQTFAAARPIVLVYWLSFAGIVIQTSRMLPTVGVAVGAGRKHGSTIVGPDAVAAFAPPKRASAGWRLTADAAEC